MHALNNFCGGPFVDKRSCEAAARQVRDKLGGAEPLSTHLSPDSGYLSIDVINLLGSANLGLHVEEAHSTWDALRRCPGASALVN